MRFRLKTYCIRRINIKVEKNHTQKVVLHLPEGSTKIGHSFYMDKYYASVAENLLEQKTLVASILKINRKRNRVDIIKKKEKSGGSISQYEKTEICDIN